MRIDLISARRTPLRLVMDGRELRQLHGPFDMFRDTSMSIPLDDVRSVTVVAPYSAPCRGLIWFLLGAAAGLFSMSTGIDFDLLRVAACLPLAMAIVLAIIPPGASTTKVLMRIVVDGRQHMLAIARENLSTFRQDVADATWIDEEEGLEGKPLNGRERLRLRLMQIGLVMTMTSVSSVAMIYLQHRSTHAVQDDMAQEALTWFLITAEIGALVIFLACWIVLIRTRMRARDIGERHSGL